MTQALEDRLRRCRRRRDTARRLALREIRERVTAFPVLDGRRGEELLGYNDAGTVG